MANRTGQLGGYLLGLVYALDIDLDTLTKSDDSTEFEAVRKLSKPNTDSILSLLSLCSCLAGTRQTVDGVLAGIA